MTKQQKRGCVLILLGLMMVLFSLGLHLVQQKQDQYAGKNARTLLRQLELKQVPVDAPDVETPEPEPTVDPAIMPEKEYMGYRIIGTIRVPSVGIELPVLSSWDYDLLNIAPCRYSGSIAGENMILMGHNYQSHFMPLFELEENAQVEFEDVNGVIYHYTVASIVTLHKNEGELLPSDYPLTLFTCTLGGQRRIVVRCERQ